MKIPGYRFYGSKQPEPGQANKDHARSNPEKYHQKIDRLG